MFPVRLNDQYGVHRAHDGGSMMAENTLFPVGDEKRPASQKMEAEPSGCGTPRLQVPIRNQILIIQSDLDSLIPDDHQARTVWAFADKADLSAVLSKIRSVEGHAGRPSSDPRVLLALWLYATLDGIGSARSLEKLCQDHVAYQWICGGNSINHHTLSDFRSNCGELLDALLMDSIASLRAKGLVTMNRVAHDGIRVRANAGQGSFHRHSTLDQFLEEAQKQVEALKNEIDEDPAASNLRRKAARERAAQERKEKVEEALRQLPDLEKKRKRSDGERRVSTTDPDARKMRMADGGWRPAFNVQFTVDTETAVIVGLDINSQGSDGGLLLPAVQQIKQRHEIYPHEVLADGGFVKKEDIETLSLAPYETTIYAPVPKAKIEGMPKDRPYTSETPEVTKWRERMGTPVAKEIYKQRASTVELVNAQARNRGLQQFPVRGLKKIRAIVMLFALAHNFVRMTKLVAA
jgi:transposase